MMPLLWSSLLLISPLSHALIVLLLLLLLISRLYHALAVELVRSYKLSTLQRFWSGRVYEHEYPIFIVGPTRSFGFCYFVGA